MLHHQILGRIGKNVMHLKRLLSLLLDKFLKPLPNPPLKGEGARFITVALAGLRGIYFNFIRGLLGKRNFWRSHHRFLAFILLSLLTVASILTCSVEPVAGTKSLLIAQSTNALELAIQAQQFYESGEFEEAVNLWQQAADSYTQEGNQKGITESLINKAEALQTLGIYPRACNTLLQIFRIDELDCKALIEDKTQQDYLITTLENYPDSVTKSIGLRSLGDVLQRLDDDKNLKLSENLLTLSLKVAQELQSAPNESAALLSLGNNELAKGKREQDQPNTPSKPKPTPLYCINKLSKNEAFNKAANYYQQAAAIESASPTTKIQANLNHLDVSIILQDWQTIKELWSKINSDLNNLPTNRTGVYAKINFAHSSICLKQTNTTDSPSWQDIAKLLATTVNQAQTINDQRTESYALGYLGGLYELNQTNSQDLIYAQDLTQKALRLAKQIEARDSTYLWEWQLGYLLKKQGDIKGAIASYTQAFYSIESLRHDLVGIPNSHTQFSFRDNIEPVYRELVKLLLQRSELSQDDLTLARNVIQSLEVAELENFLQCSLVDNKPEQLDEMIDRDGKTAAIYPIILDNRLDIILKLPNQNLIHRWSQDTSRQDVETSLDTLSIALSKLGDIKTTVLPLSGMVYDWLIRPLEADLKEIKTLVFVLDSSLRKIPIAALYNSQTKKYLVEDYATAVVSSSQVLEPESSKQEGLKKALIAGLTKQRQNLKIREQSFSFSALNNIDDELEEIKKIFPNYTVLLNDKFQTEAFQKELTSSGYTVVHLATHGNFSSDPKLTFILTASDNPINVEQLRDILRIRNQRQPEAIALLVLSACQTAEGDRRATLGLAGMAVRSGARSTLGTLWKVDDQSTSSLMSHFYQELITGNVSKAVALQQAQLTLLNNQQKQHPYFWAPFIVVGNWQ
ncbi:MAG TPA: CHAT domain-containing protein [Cyanobacteria bacterium UBA11370]|nr:CHAT domain-containing protein [Cyanobacteria bacterium UBA11370]